MNLPPILKSTFAKALSILAAFYILLYGVLSVNGQYRPSMVAIGGYVGYTWAPMWFYDSNSRSGEGWRSSWVLSFYPLWIMDVCYIHKGVTKGPHHADKS
jgi:hypothetical protein